MYTIDVSRDVKMKMDGFIYEYANDRGAVAIDMVVADGLLSFNVCRVLCRADAKYTTSVLPFKSFAEAKAFYDGFVKYLSGPVDEMMHDTMPCDMCRHDDKNTRKCSPLSCPKKRGGRSFWVMFRDVCKYRGM